jgi:ABC-type polysaccharide/polyol phosphate transport system ATPase subunit
MARIDVDRLGLTFRVPPQGRPTLKDLFVHGFSTSASNPPGEVHALRDVNLHASDGDRIGVLGHNGAGKSTLLKVLAGVYPPTSGRCQVQGRISSLFDIALGFEPDGTGRENIYYRGYLQGETPASIRSKVGAITEFSELGSFLDVPVRFYSTGMRVRLAFAIATAVEPEVLLVDEVLSVGDLSFQTKARQRMKEMMARARVMVVVSHDLDSLLTMCNRAVWLEHGTVQMEGPVADVVAAYRAKVTYGPEPGAGAEKAGHFGPAEWSVAVPPGRYEVRATWQPGEGHASNAPYRLFDGAGPLATVRVNQRMAPFGTHDGQATFQILGCHRVESGWLRVVLGDDADWPVQAGSLRVAEAPEDGPLLCANGQEGYSETGNGWRTHWGRGGFSNRYSYVAPGDGTEAAQWQMTRLARGSYDVFATWQAHANRASNAPFHLIGDGEPARTVRINQQQAPADIEVHGTLFARLGRVVVGDGILRVVLRNDADGYVIADAIHVAPVPTWGPVIVPPGPAAIPEMMEREICASS